MKTVVVLGGSYGGARAARVLAESIPDDWRIILIERNTHANHLYVLPRFAVLPGHEHKAFIPYSHLFGTCPHHHLVLHATITSLTTHAVTMDRAFPHLGLHSPTISFDFCVYALGSHLPAPIDLWCETEECSDDLADVLGGENDLSEGEQRRLKERKVGSKQEGVDWLRRSQIRIKESASILIVGGGALGIQFASDIKAVYPDKDVTLLHSRARLLPRFDSHMHEEILQTLDDLGVKTILSTRLDRSSLSPHSRKVRTATGETLAADLLLLCTGQTPNTALLRSFAPECIDDETQMARVRRTLQLVPIPSSAESKPERSEFEELLADFDLSDDGSDGDSISTPYGHFFVIGDAADAFGAIKAGHNAYYQADVAARNILSLIQARKACLQEEDIILEVYKPAEPMIKVSVGLRQSVYQHAGIVGTKSDGNDDLDAPLIWSYYGAEVDAEGGMLR